MYQFSEELQTVLPNELLVKESQGCDLGVTFPVVYKVIWSRADSSLRLDNR